MSEAAEAGSVPVVERNTPDNTGRLVASAAYITLVIGYALSIVQASSLNVQNLLGFTLIQLLYVALFYLLTEKTVLPHLSNERRIAVFCAGFSVLTIINGLFALTGSGFDWLLYLVTLALYVTFFSLRPAIIACILLYLEMSANLALIYNWHLNGSFYQSAAILLPAFCFVALFTLANKQLETQKLRTEQLLNQLAESNAELEQAHAQLQVYADEVEELTIVRERTRLAREIHDTLGHYLSILNIQLETISKLQERDPQRAKIEVEVARQVAAQSMQEVRNAVAALRPSSIATLSLTEALARLGKEFEQVTPEAILTLDLDTQLPHLSPDVQVTLYRVAQESLTNVRKHAHATKVLLRLRYEENVLELLVRDNGQGLDGNKPRLPGGGFGLVGLRERVELLGGNVTYDSVEQSGFRVTVQVPFTSTPGES